jgi:hypothetical protein
MSRSNEIIEQNKLLIKIWSFEIIEHSKLLIKVDGN